MEEITIHIPVLLEKTAEMLITDPDGVYIDATLGTGGHAEKILKTLAGKGTLIGLDADPEAVNLSENRLRKYPNFFPVHVSYTEVRRIIFHHGFRRVNGILFDLGLSSLELEDPQRGFSFQSDGPLDMRFNKEGKKTAALVINDYRKEELSEIFKKYGEERRSGVIASAIVKARQKGRIKTTGELRKIIQTSIGAGKSIKTLARIFQALRIEVNNELENLSETLSLLPDIIRSGGRAVFITYHSVEDRIVKLFFNRESRDCICPPEVPVCRCEHQALFKILTNKPLYPSPEEIKANRKARSAKMRVFERI